MLVPVEKLALIVFANVVLPTLVQVRKLAPKALVVWKLSTIVMNIIMLLII
jgi:hypothetical protein